MGCIDYRFQDDWPELLMTDDLDAVFDQLNITFNKVIDGVCEFNHLYDVDLIPDSLLDIYILGFGIRLSVDFPGIAITNVQKRKLARLAIDIFNQKGTASGIINIIRLLLGLDAAVITQTNVDVWKVGESLLGEDTILAPDPSVSRKYIYGFEIVLNEVVTQETKDKITTIANYMKSIHTHLLGIIEPFEFDHWELGFSELGSTTDLHL